MSVEVPYYHYGTRAGSTLVDDDIAEMIDGRRLTQCGGYVFLGSMQLHRLVMGCKRKDGNVVHHRNEDKTDNRRENLQVVVGEFAHGALPHPWRDRISGIAWIVGGLRAREIVELERARAGLRPIGGYLDLEQVAA